MIKQEELAKQMKLITQNAWREASNTTINNVCEYICRESLNIVLESLENEFYLINKKFQELNGQLEELDNASTDGGISQPQRNTEAQDKRGRGNAKARTADAANGYEQH